MTTAYKPPKMAAARQAPALGSGGPHRDASVNSIAALQSQQLPFRNSAASPSPSRDDPSYLITPEQGQQDQQRGPHADMRHFDSQPERATGSNIPGGQGAAITAEQIASKLKGLRDVIKQVKDRDVTQTPRSGSKSSVDYALQSARSHRETQVVATARNMPEAEEAAMQNKIILLQSKLEEVLRERNGLNDRLIESEAAAEQLTKDLWHQQTEHSKALSDRDKTLKSVCDQLDGAKASEMESQKLMRACKAQVLSLTEKNEDLSMRLQAAQLQIQHQTPQREGTSIGSPPMQSRRSDGSRTQSSLSSGEDATDSKPDAHSKDHRAQVAEKKVASLVREMEQAEHLEAKSVRLKEKIGVGSFSEVFSGELCLPVGIKKMKPLTKRQQVDDFYREAKLHCSLHHPGIVRFRGIVAAVPDMFVITELVNGHSLEDILHVKKTQLSIESVLSYALQISDALAYMHHRGVVHRDLKASNCLVASNNVLKICDFGLARRLHGRFIDSPSRAGTPVYLAPEALHGLPATEKIDVYSFAVVMYEMLTGKQIWEELSYDSMVDKVANKHHRPNLPGKHARLESLIQECWAPRPEERPSFRRALAQLKEMGAKMPRQRTANSHEVELV